MIRKFFQSLTRSVRGAALLNSGVEAFARGEYETAFGKLRGVYSLFGVEVGSPKAPYDLNLLTGSVLCKMEMYDTAVKILATAERQLMDEKGLSSDEVSYLRYYGVVAGRYAMSRLSPEFLNDDIKSLFDVEFDEVDPDKVPQHLKRRFPVAHPATDQLV